MKLPNAASAYVPRSKLSEYLLSETHVVGKSKARFFRRFGFNEKNLALLERGLISIALDNELAEQTSTPHGNKYTIDGVLETPTGRTITIRTVWIIEEGEDNPRFVTAHPA